MGWPAASATSPPGKREEYHEEHKNVPDALEETYLMSDAGLETCSFSEDDGYVFGSWNWKLRARSRAPWENEMKDEWKEVMVPIVEGDETWVDEVYRLI